ncbi:TPA: MalY/PatB family protein [Klebsiella oxytoca]
MSEYSFDTIISRFGTHSAKYRDKNPDVIPLSVADMDIPLPYFITEALARANEKGIYGYTLLSDDWQNMTAGWFARHYNWHIDPGHIVFCPRVIQAVSLYIQNFTHTGDTIVSLTPAYHPVSHAVEINQRKLLESPLRYHGQCYEIDFDDLESKFKQACCFILLSPHNPTGTTWSEYQLKRIAVLAEKYNVFIISDDVHADFIFGGNHHLVISSVSTYVQQNSFICTSPAKTFNMAGLEVANIVIANDKHREKFKKSLIAAGIHNPGYFSVPAFLAAYRHGDTWLAELKDYLAENKRWVLSFCHHYFPEWFCTSGNGTYMLWIDYQTMGISETQLRYWFTALAKVEMSWGSGFGSEGLGFFRVNIATPRTVLQQAFQRIYETCPYPTGVTHNE